MSKSSNYWDKRAIKRLTDAEKMSDVYINRIKNIYNQAYRNIDKEITRVYKNYSKETGLDVEKLKELLTKKETDKVWKTLERQGLTKYIKDNYKSRISRLEQIQAQIYGKAKLIYPKEELEQTMCYKGVINDSYYKAIYDTQMGTGFDFSFNKIDNNMTQTLLNEKWSGKNYSQRIWGNTDILAETVSQLVGGALLSGQGIEKTSKQLRDRFNVGKHYAERLVRTETNHFNNEADAMAYEEMGVDKYVFVATLDSRTSVMCQEMDNQVFNYKDIKKGYNYPPLHPNCRSKTRGYLGEDAEKLLKRRARNPITGKNEVIDNMSYKEWMSKHGLHANSSSNTYENHPKPKLLGNLNNYKTKSIENILEDYEKIIKDDIIENAIVITTKGEIYQCFGNENNVWVDVDLGDKLIGASVTHNHPEKATYFGFSRQDINLFEKYKLKVLRGVDYEYIYELNTSKKGILNQVMNIEDSDSLEHLRTIEYANSNNLYYKRWKNE